jgi:outer membrane murein-binding lipoprotein Lpp
MSYVSGLLMAAVLFLFVPSNLVAQATPSNQDVQSLRQEVGELKARIAMLEAKLDAFAAPPPSGR